MGGRCVERGWKGALLMGWLHGCGMGTEDSWAGIRMELNGCRVREGIHGCGDV